MPGDDLTVLGIEPTTGAVAWQTPPMGSLDASPVLVFADGGDTYYRWEGADLVARRAGEAAERLWRTTAADPEAGLNTAMVFDGDTMYVAGDKLYAVDRRSGGCLWTPPAAEPLLLADSLRAAGHGHCYLADDESVTALAAF